jgi:adenylate cyclase
VTIDTADAHRDRRTAELHAAYLAPLDINNVHISPIMLNGRAAGMLCVEDPRRGDRAAGMAPFCDALAILLALRFAAGTATVPAAVSPVPHVTPPSHGEVKTADAFAPRQTRLERLLFQHNASLESLGQAALPNVAVGVVKLPDWTTVAQRPTDGGGHTAMDAIVHEVRDVLEKSDVSYAALLDDEVVLAAFSADQAQAPRDATLVAMAMLELRDRLTRLGDKWGVDLDFRLALDVGTVMTSTIAGDPPSRNLWGGAVGIAKILAATAARHTITASETAYELLAGQFLLRPRGTYFLPETGNMRTFIIVGRL